MPKTWEGFYPVPCDLPTLQHLRGHHKAFYQMIKQRVLPPRATLLEVGVGNGALAWGLLREGYRYVGLDNNLHVAGMAADTLKAQGLWAPIYFGNAFSLPPHLPKLDAIVSQGFMEHFTVPEVQALIRHHTNVAPLVMFSVPSIHYPTQDKGDENLWDIDTWAELLGDFHVPEIAYYGGPNGNYHILTCVLTG